MSVAFERNDHRIERPGFVRRMTCIPIYNSPEFAAGDRWIPAKDADVDDSYSSSSSSSIGRNSDESPARSSDSGAGDGDGEEVQSAFKGGALDSLEALEEVLPIKRGISKFYAGKSKSFTSLAGAASCSSLKDIVKPENAYSRKRKNLLAHNNFFENSNRFPRSNTGGVYKRPTNSRSAFSLAASGSCSGSNDSSESLSSSPSLSHLALPPLPPQSRRLSKETSLPSTEQKFSAWRSYSLSDLQGTDAVPCNLTGVKE